MGYALICQSSIGFDTDDSTEICTVYGGILTTSLPRLDPPFIALFHVDDPNLSPSIWQAGRANQGLAKI